jgi:protocatechuate 3,4-dioxygenase beta subunit
MGEPTDYDRRLLLAGGASALALGAAPGLAALAPTPSQTRGPFYPPKPPLEADNDLVRVHNRSGLAAGVITDLTGRLVDPSGQPLDDARVEIWQCDANGRYHHPSAPRQGRDPAFQGFGTCTTDRDGQYRFRTIKPVPYPGRTPHIHFRVVAPGMPEFITQMYIAGHRGNADDPIFNRAGGDRARLAVAFEPAADADAECRARFDLVVNARG